MSISTQPLQSTTHTYGEFDLDRLYFYVADDLSDTYISSIFKTMMREDAKTSYFYQFDMTFYNDQMFINFARDDSRVFVVAEYDGKAAAVMSVENLLPGLGSISYYGMRFVRGKQSVYIGKVFLIYMLKYYNTLIGISPITKGSSMKFNERIGMKEIGIIPGACYIARENKYVDGLLTQIDRRAL